MSLTIAGEKVGVGERKKLNVFVAKLYDTTEMGFPVEVIRGKKDGPTLFISAAIHGNEINGVEIIRHIAQHKWIKHLKGNLILVPIVNVFGFNNKTRYLPDRRDLNRSFPGAKNGSLASRLAYIFMKEIVSNATHGLDLHTGAIHRSNLPQIRTMIDNKVNLKLAKAFGVSAIVNSSLRDGSLREAALAKKMPMLLYEGGEALRFDHEPIRLGVHGVLNLLHEIGMLHEKDTGYIPTALKAFVGQSSYWLRAPTSGILKTLKKPGVLVEKNELLATISDPFGEKVSEIRAERPGLIVGYSMLPLVTNGDATFHVAVAEKSKGPEDASIEYLDDKISTDVYDPQIEE